MISKNSSLHRCQERVQTIDFIKGVDIVFMVIFNYSVTLSYLGLIHIQPDLFYRSFPLIIASIFIFLSGSTAYISLQNDEKNFGRRYLFRGIKLFIFATFITIFTKMFVPDGTIYFGILHFFAISSFLVPIFIKYDKFNSIAGVLIILSGIYLQMKEFSFTYLLWLGFIPENFTTFDYFPLIPWMGVLLLGISFGKSIIDRTGHIEFKSEMAKAFIFFGKKSLTLYLIHQPVLIFFLMLIGIDTFFK